MNVTGSLPLLILNVLAAGTGYGYQIAKEIKDRSGGILDFQEGTLYPTLHRLLKDGLIEAYTTKVDGRVRRYYRLTEEGVRALADARNQWTTYSRAVTMALGEAQ